MTDRQLSSEADALETRAADSEGPARTRHSRRRRLIRWITLPPALVLVLFFGGGGWYFASQIRSDALFVEESEPPEYEFEVTAVEQGLVSLRLPAEEDEDLVSSEILGLDWATGYGQVGSVEGITGTEVTRVYTQVAGSPLQVGEMVRLEGYAYPPDPQVLGIRFETVSYTSDFGDFPAWFIDGSESSTWAIFVHGRGAHHREGLRILPVLVEAGLPSLLITYRNDDDVPATSDHLARFGETEWVDLEGAVRYALDHGADQVVLVGYSMGGAIAVSFMYESDLAGKVRAVILDSPALELGAMVDARAAETNIPVLGFKVPTPLTAAAKTVAGWRFDVDWGGLDYLSRVDELDKPILLFHGTDDGTVPVWTSDALAEARPDLVTYERVEGADHVRAWNVDRARYEAAVAAFLNLHL